MVEQLKLTEVQMVKYEKHVIENGFTLKEVFSQNMKITMERKKYMFAVPQIAELEIIMGLDENIYVKNLKNGKKHLLQQKSSEGCCFEKEKNYFYTLFYITDDDMLELRIYFERPQVVELAGYEKQYIYISDIKQSKSLEFKRLETNQEGPEIIEIQFEADDENIEVRYNCDDKRMVKKMGIKGEGRIASFIPIFSKEDEYGGLQYSVLRIGNGKVEKKTFELELANYEKIHLTLDNTIAENFILSFKRERGIYDSPKNVGMGFLAEKDRFVIKVKGEEKIINRNESKKEYTALVEILENELYVFKIREL